MAEVKWVYDPETKHVYQGYPFEGLTELETGPDGQPVLPASIELADTDSPAEPPVVESQSAPRAPRARKSASKAAPAKPASDSTDASSEETSK